MLIGAVYRKCMLFSLRIRDVDCVSASFDAPYCRRSA
jgi:hypothetical protein